MSKQLKDDYEKSQKDLVLRQQEMQKLQQQKAELESLGRGLQEMVQVNNQIQSLQNEINRLQPEYNRLQTEYSNAFGINQNLNSQISVLKEDIRHSVAQKNIYDSFFTDIDSILDKYSDFSGQKIDPVKMVILQVPRSEMHNSTALKKACEKRSKEAFDELLKKINNINAVDSQGMTLLMYSLKHGFWYGVEKLLELGADVNIIDTNGCNALIYACTLPHEKYINLITKDTQDINAKSNLGNTAIHSLLQGSKMLYFSEFYDKNNPQSIIYPGSNMTMDVEGAVIPGMVIGERADGFTLYQEKLLKIIKVFTDRGADINCINNAGLSPFFLAMKGLNKYASNQLLKDYKIPLEDHKSMKDELGRSLIHFSIIDHNLIRLLISKGFSIGVTNQDGTTVLQSAISNALFESIKLLIDSGANIRHLDNHENNCWHYLAQNHSTNIDAIKQVASLLLPYNISINSQNIVGQTPFYFACAKGNIQAMFFLKELGADISILAQNGFHPIYGAVHHGHTAMIEELLKLGVAIDTKSTNGYTPLQYYCELPNNNHSIVDFLLSKGASLNSHQGNNLKTILHSAAGNNNPQILELLLKKVLNKDAVTNDQYKITPLWLTAQNGNLEMLKVLINYGADVNIARADNKMPPLYVAMQKKHDAVAKYLLSKGANTNLADAGGAIAIHWATDLGNPDIMKEILSKPINVNAKNSAGGTALFYAVARGNEALVELLVKSQADPNICNNDGMYPWHVAAFNGLKNIMQIMFSNGFDIDVKTNNVDQYTGLWGAAQNGHNEVVKWLIANSANVNHARISDGRTALQAGICSKHSSTIKLLVDNKADVNKVDNNQVSPLYYAVELKDKALIKFLIEHKADVNKAVDSGDQPMHMATALSDMSSLKLLLDNNASINAINNIGNTPLHEVLWDQSTASNAQKLTAIKYLLIKSASTNIQDNNGKTIIDLAKQHITEAVPWLEHPENLPTLAEFETSIFNNNNIELEIPITGDLASNHT